MKYFVIALGLLWHHCVIGQTTLIAPHSVGRLEVYDMFTSGNIILGCAYVIDPDATCAIVFAPSTKELYEANLAMAGTYTSPNGKVLGLAYRDSIQVGTIITGSYVKPNAWLCADSGMLKIGEKPSHTAIEVFKMIQYNTILNSVVLPSETKVAYWRFFVEERWYRYHSDSAVEKGINIMIINFTKPFTLRQACLYVQGLKRHEIKNGVEYKTLLTACLLDTELSRSYFLTKFCQDGSFLQKLSNAIVVK